MAAPATDASGYTPLGPEWIKGAPEDGGLTFQTQYTDDGRFALFMHDAILLPIITIISIFVLALLIYFLMPSDLAQHARLTAATAAPLAQALHHAQLVLHNAGTGGDRRTQEQDAACVDQLRAGANGIQLRFADALAASLAGIRGQPRAAPTSLAAPVELSLSLLDDEAASDEAMLEATASRAEVRNSLALQLLAHRLGVLAGRPCFELEDMPLGPHRLTRAFVDAIVPLQLSPRAHVALFEQFDAHVMAAYPAILDLINGTLVGGLVGLILHALDGL